MSCPRTREELIDWFCSPETHNGPTRDPAQLIPLVDNLLGRPNPWIKWDKDPMDAGDVWNVILDNGMLCLGGRFGWVKPDGEFLTCSYAAHEKLLTALGLVTAEVEEQGWARVGLYGRVQNRYRLTRQQVRKLGELGYEVERDFTKPRLPQT